MLRVLTSRARNATSYHRCTRSSAFGLPACQVPPTPPLLSNAPRFLSSLDTTDQDRNGTTSSKGTGTSLLQTIKRVLAAANAAKAEKAKSGVDEGAANLDGVTLRRLWEFARPEIVPLSVSVATLGVTTAISLLFPYAIGQILDVALKPDAVLSPTSISLGLLGLFVVQSGMITLRSALLTISGERIAASIRKDLFQSIVVQETAWFDKNRTGDIINRLSSDTAVIQKALTVNIAGGLRAGAMVVGGAGMLFYLSPSLALLSLGLIPPVALAGMYYGKYLQGQQKAVQEALGRTTDVAEEIISAMRTVRQFARETREAARFAVKVDDAYGQAKHIGIIAAYFDGVVHMAANISLIAVLWYGGNQVWTGAMSAGDLTAFLMYSLYTGFNISNLSSVYTDLKRAAGAATRVIDITDREPTIPISSSVQVWDEMPAVADSHAVLSSSSMKCALPSIPQAAGLLEFRDVFFRYPTRPDTAILDGFSLRVPAGQHVAVVGRSGSGKSTVGALLTRLYDPERGAVYFDGMDIKTLDPMKLRSNVGVVSQEPTLFATSVLENIKFGKPDASVEEVEAAAYLANVHDDIIGFPQGYNTIVGERGAQLSGGQKQRIAIARALIKKPPVLVLDEATSALDAQSEQRIMLALQAMVPNPTVITIAHRLSTMQHAHEVAVIESGKIVEQGAFHHLESNQESVFSKFIRQQIVRQV